jgi:hypothetical protein
MGKAKSMWLLPFKLAIYLSILKALDNMYSRWCRMNKYSVDVRNKLNNIRYTNFNFNLNLNLFCRFYIYEFYHARFVLLPFKNLVVIYLVISAIKYDNFMWCVISLNYKVKLTSIDIKVNAHFYLLIFKYWTVK